MQEFSTISGVAAPMPLVNIDNDMILPKQYLKTIKRTGLGVHLFEELRYHSDGREIQVFILNQQAYRNSKIIVAGDNFGCGSSREHAPWAILDFGVRCVISTTFAEIFFNNCFKNGILPITLPQNDVDVLMDHAWRGANAIMTVDLVEQAIPTFDGTQIAFQIETSKRECLLQGLDEIGLTLEKSDHIKAFEKRMETERPWLFPSTKPEISETREDK